MATNAFTDFKLAGNPATHTARLKAMARGGQLVIAHDHWLSAMMPDAFPDASESCVARKWVWFRGQPVS